MSNPSMIHPTFKEHPQYWENETLAEVKKQEIMQDESLQLEAVYEYINAQEDLSEEEYRALDNLFKKMPNLIEKSVNWYAEKIAKKEDEKKEDARIEAQISGAYF